MDRATCSESQVCDDFAAQGQKYNSRSRHVAKSYKGFGQLFTSQGARRESGPIQRGKRPYVTDVLENSFNDNKTAVRKRTEQVGTVVAIPSIRGVKSNLRRTLSRVGNRFDFGTFSRHPIL